MALLIHPGYHKTGTSWMQERLFTDVRLFNSLLSHAAVDRAIVRPHDFAFNPAAARAAIDAHRTPDGDGRVDVISSEILVGNPFFGARDAMTLAQRLHLCAPDARILLTVRAQPAIMRSLYQQYLKRGGTLPAADFLSPSVEPGYFGFDPVLLEFDRLADHYAVLFGAARVLVLPQELLISEPRRFVDTMLRFAGHAGLPDDVAIASGERSGKSFPPGGTPLMKLANYARSSPINPGGPSWSKAPADMLVRFAYRFNVGSERQARAWRRAIEQYDGRYDASNHRLQRYCPVSLSGLGYGMTEALS